MTEHFNPLQDAISKRATASSPPSADKVTAGHSLNSTDQCPHCNNKMRILTIGDRSKQIRAHVCMADRIALPLKD